MNFNNFLDPLQVLSDCALCPRGCHANRLTGKSGYCKSDASFNISSICIHRGEEPPVSGKDGICNIFFTNCNLQCIYCQNHQISINKPGRNATTVPLEDVISQIISFLDKGIRRVGFVSPSHFIPQVKIIISIIESLGFKPVWVYNSNGYDKVETLKSLEGSIDVFLPDMKYMDPVLAEEFSDTLNYPDVAGSALREMYRQKGSALHLNNDGTVESGIIIRHLVLPGHLQNSVDVLRFIRNELSPKLHISLMSQYYPTPRVAGHPHLGRTVTKHEYEMVVEEMGKLGLHNGWIQEYESSSHYQPDFEKEHPFE